MGRLSPVQNLAQRKVMLISKQASFPSLKWLLCLLRESPVSLRDAIGPIFIGLSVSQRHICRKTTPSSITASRRTSVQICHVSPTSIASEMLPINVVPKNVESITQFTPWINTRQAQFPPSPSKIIPLAVVKCSIFSKHAKSLASNILVLLEVRPSPVHDHGPFARKPSLYSILQDIACPVERGIRAGAPSGTRANEEKLHATAQSLGPTSELRDWRTVPAYPGTCCYAPARRRNA